MFIKISSTGNSYNKSCEKLQENDIIHTISNLLIIGNPTVRRQEMKAGNKFLVSKFIFQPKPNSVSFLCLCDLCDVYMPCL